MRRFLGLWALLLVAPALAQEEPEEEPKPPEPAIEDLVGGGVTSKRRDGPGVRVRLHSGGQLQFRGSDRKWTDTTLAGLGEFLARARDEHHAKAQKAGKSGYEAIRGIAKVSNLFVAIEADPGTPWQHIQWLMTVAAEQKYWKLDLKCEKRRILTCLPVAKPAEDAGAEIVVPIHVVARAEKAARWGGGMVMRPTTFKYRQGNREASDLAGVARMVQDGKRAAAKEGEPTVVAGEIQAGNKVPFAQVLDVMEVFVKEGVARVRFHSQVPVDQMRKAERLPYPVKNYETAD